MSSILDFIEDIAPNMKNEMSKRFEELSTLEKDQVQLGTAVPQLYGSLSRFVANPSTVSVETYKRILDTDETIGAGIDFMNLAMIASFGEYTHPNEKVQQFVRRALQNMEGSWHENLDEMFSAEWAGFSVTEQVWKFEEDFDGAPAFVPARLVTYPPLTIVFAVDRNGRVLPDGIFQYQRYHNTYFSGGQYGTFGPLEGFRPDTLAAAGDLPYPVRIAADLSYLTVRMPKDKMIHLRSSSTGKFDNPYGRSILRRAYKNWIMKDAFLKMWIIAADRKGTPLVVGYAAPNDSVYQQNQVSGDGNAPVASMRADQAMAATFKSIHNSSFIVLPGKKGEVYDVEAIQVQGDMNVFKDAVSYFNTALMRAMLLPPLVMGGGDGAGSFALGSEHHKIFQKVINGKLKPYKQAILEQFIRKLIAYNFPHDVWAKDGLGDFASEEHDPELMEKLINVFRSATEAGYIDPAHQEDLDFVRAKIGMKKKKAVTVEEVDDAFDSKDTNQIADGDGDEPTNDFSL